MSPQSRSVRRRIAVVAGAMALSWGLAGCVPDAPAAVSETPETNVDAPVGDASAAGVTVVPSTCAELLPDETLSRLSHLSLNDPEMQSAGLESGIANTELAELAESERALSCVWRNPDSETTFLRTTVVRIDGGDGAAAVKLLTDDRIQCYPAQEGTRCEFTTQRSQPSVQFGETHYFRDDLWIATAWSNVAPPGYTASIVATLWP